MSDTRELSHNDLDDIVMSLQRQSANDDQASVSDESAYESDDTGQVLAVDEHNVIFPMAEPYWCVDYEFEFSNLYDGGLCAESLLTMSSAICTMMSCAICTMMSCGYPQFPGQWLPTRVKLNWHLSHSHCLLPFVFQRLSSCLCSGVMPPSVGILHSGSAGLKPSCCQLRRSWLMMQLVLHQWNKYLRDQHQSSQLTIHHCHCLSLVTSHHCITDCLDSLFMDPLTALGQISCS